MHTGEWAYIGLEHITLWVRSRLLWDGSTSADEILDDYCDKFYGPAAKPMRRRRSTSRRRT